ncbi:MAG: sensor histidine kinase [Cellvibrionaceae bacterium]
MNNQHSQALPLLPYLCQPSAILSLVLIGELLAIVLLLAGNNMIFSWSKLGAISLVIQWIMLSSALILCQVRPLINRLKPLWSGMLSYGICLSIVAIVLTVAQFVSLEPFNVLVWLKGFLMGAIFSGILLRYLYLQQQLSNQQQAELQARLQSLQSRIRPHFLFNSMNTIASLISINPQAAEKTVEDLSSLFRSSLQQPGLVSLSNEVDLCRRYMAIEQQRLGDRLEMVWEIDDTLPDIQVPSLFLQPLLENAIVHGIQNLPDGGSIRLCISSVSSENEPQKVLIMVENPTSSIALSTVDEGNHIALNNIEHRLNLHYKKEATIKTFKDEQSYRVEVIIPQTLPLKSQ